MLTRTSRLGAEMHFGQLERRAFLSLLGGAVTYQRSAHAQPSNKLPTIGFIGSGSTSTQGQAVTRFALRLRDLGWVEGRTVAIEYRWIEGRNERAVEITAEFVRLKVDIIVTVGTPATAAAKHATSVIPIICLVVSDPVGSGFVASLSRPGGNITGLSNQAADIATKRLELLRDIVPNLRRVAIMANIGNPVVLQEMHEVQAAAGPLGLVASLSQIRQTQDIETAIEALKGGVEALYVCTDGLTISNRVRVNTFAQVARLPTIHGNRDSFEGGGLMSYGANVADLFARGADLVDKVLRGTKPADIPVELPTKFDLAVNLITAKALGLDVPPTLLARADEVIE
jgi:putative ABC transport system substrate-binding protein